MPIAYDVHWYSAGRQWQSQLKFFDKKCSTSNNRFLAVRFKLLRIVVEFVGVLMCANGAFRWSKITAVNCRLQSRPEPEQSKHFYIIFKSKPSNEKQIAVIFINLGIEPDQYSKYGARDQRGRAAKPRM